jgi:hypothetical protein
MEIWRAGGGYVFQQVHNLMADTTPTTLPRSSTNDPPELPGCMVAVR